VGKERQSLGVSDGGVKSGVGATAKSQGIHFGHRGEKQRGSGVVLKVSTQVRGSIKKFCISLATERVGEGTGKRRAERKHDSVLKRSGRRPTEPEEKS